MSCKDKNELVNLGFSTEQANWLASLSTSIVNANMSAKKCSKDISDVRKELGKVNRFQKDVEEEYTILPGEASDLNKAVKNKVCEVLGGNTSNAYNQCEKTNGGKNTYPLRVKVFRDIWIQIKRNFGLIDDRGVQMGYTKLKRKYLRPALDFVQTYTLPIVLEDEVSACNELDMDFED